MADLPATVSHGAAGSKKYVSQDARDKKKKKKKKKKKAWLILRIQRLCCGEEECEMLEHVAERRLSQKDVAEDAVTAWDHGKGI